MTEWRLSPWYIGAGLRCRAWLATGGARASDTEPGPDDRQASMIDPTGWYSTRDPNGAPGAFGPYGGAEGERRADAYHANLWRGKGDRIDVSVLDEVSVPTPPPPLAVWWLDQAATEAVRAWLGASGSAGWPASPWPAYLREEFRSREGRAGRGRLWVSAHLAAEGVAVEPWPPGPVGEWILASGAAGIVLLGTDVPALVDLPGLVTDLRLRRWAP